MELKSNRVHVADALEAVELYFHRRWSDGLPIVPPTPELVEGMISYVARDPQEEIGGVPPAGGAATIEKLAVNSVMAGCLPEYFPVIIAAVEALLVERHNLHGTQTTTHCAEPLVIVNGPAASKLNINSRESVFGRGYRANGCIGRAIRLILWNLGGNYPGEVDKSCLSHPGSWSFCIAENEDASPWEPLHVERGLARGSSAVTVFACEAPHSVFAHGAIEEMLAVTASAMMTMGNNNFIDMGEMLVVLNPHNAQQLADAGWSKADVKRRLWEMSKMPWGLRKKFQPFLLSATAPQLPKWATEAGDDTLVPLTEKPEDIHLIVAGGLYFNAVCPGWGHFGGFASTKEIRMA